MNNTIDLRTWKLRTFVTHESSKLGANHLAIRYYNTARKTRLLSGAYHHSFLKHTVQITSITFGNHAKAIVIRNLIMPLAITVSVLHLFYLI